MTNPYERGDCWQRLALLGLGGVVERATNGGWEFRCTVLVDGMRVAITATGTTFEEVACAALANLDDLSDWTARPAE